MGLFRDELCDNSLRAIMCFAASDSLKNQKQVQVDQGEVWDHVDSVLDGSGASSPTNAYHAMYGAWSEQIADYEAELPCPNDAFGIVLQIDGHVEAVDLFDKPQTTRQMWPKLLRSYAVGAMREQRNSKRKQKIRQFLTQAISSELESFAAIGAGTTARFTNSEVSGAALFCDEQLVHFSLFTRQASK